MSKNRLKLSYRIKARINKTLDEAMDSVALSAGFKAEPYATGFNFRSGERELVYDEQV